MPKRSSKTPLVPQERIEQSILLIRGHKVMIDADLALLYDVPAKNLNRAVSRNRERFPPDFMFQLTAVEFENLRFHFGTSRSWGGRRYLPYAFTQEGVAMLSSVLRSKRAIAVNIEIVRVFTRLRKLLSSHVDLLRRLDDLEKKYDKQFQIVFDAIRQLMTPPQDPPKRRIGYQTEEDV